MKNPPILKYFYPFSSDFMFKFAIGTESLFPLEAVFSGRIDRMHSKICFTCNKIQIV